MGEGIPGTVGAGLRATSSIDAAMTQGIKPAAFSGTSRGASLSVRVPRCEVVLSIILEVHALPIHPAVELRA